MQFYLDMLDVPEADQQKFDEEKINFISAKISVQDFFNIPQSFYLACSSEEKSKMFKFYYDRLVDKYFGGGKKDFVCCI